MHLVHQFVLKVHSRCNLACNHCYVYEAADQSWRTQPMAISEKTVSTAAASIASYARNHALTSVGVVLHGGEPLLLGHARMSEVLRTLASTIGAVCTLDLSVQTNGVLLDEEFARLFGQYQVQVGISLDGGKIANDRHRVFAHGGSSYDEVVRAVTLLTRPEHREIFAGLLCTVDVDNEPLGVYEDLAGLLGEFTDGDPGTPLPMIDLLLPHATWEDPPPAAGRSESPYGDWLAVVFDRWFHEPPRVGIRLFEELLNTLLGGASRSEVLGTSLPDSIIIETDGTLEQTDALKVAFDGAAATGYNIFEHSLDDLLGDPAAFTSAAYSQLSAECVACPVVDNCGGGLYPHRYRMDTGYANPSVYCTDLMRLITHVDATLNSSPLPSA